MSRLGVRRKTGRLVTPEQHVAQEGPDASKRGVWAGCPSCTKDMFVYGHESPNVSMEFHHRPGSRCPLSSDPDPRYAHLVPAGWDLDTGKRLRRTFCERTNIAQAYNVCRALCGPVFHLKSRDFIELCRIADEMNIWSYRDLPLWVMPYLLATLGTYKIEKDTRNGNAAYTFRIVLIKKRAEPVDVVWNGGRTIQLQKYFVDSGRKMRHDPVPIPWKNAEAERGRTDWMSARLLDRLMECCRSGHRTAS